MELIREDGSTCNLPPLPAGRYAHTQSGLTSCGGSGGEFSDCITFSKGQWVTSHTLSNGHTGLLAWSSHPDGVLLFGGMNRKTELLSTNSSTTQPLFEYPYYHFHACGIDVPGSDFVITGGHVTDDGDDSGRVVKYSIKGEATLLPRLQEPRYHHGCGYYYDQNNVLVSFNIMKLLWIFYTLLTHRHIW